MTTATTLAGPFTPATPVLTAARRSSSTRARATAGVAFALAMVWLAILMPGLTRVPAVAGRPGPLGAPVGGPLVATTIDIGRSADAAIALPGPHPDR